MRRFLRQPPHAARLRSSRRLAFGFRRGHARRLGPAARPAQVAVRELRPGAAGRPGVDGGRRRGADHPAHRARRAAPRLFLPTVDSPGAGPATPRTTGAAPRPRSSGSSRSRTTPRFARSRRSRRTPRGPAGAHRGPRRHPAPRGAYRRRAQVRRVPRGRRADPLEFGDEQRPEGLDRGRGRHLAPRRPHGRRQRERGLQGGRRGLPAEPGRDRGERGSDRLRGRPRAARRALPRRAGLERRRRRRRRRGRGAGALEPGLRRPGEPGRHRARPRPSPPRRPVRS